MKGTRVSNGKGNGCVFDARRKGQGDASIQTNGDVQSNFRFCRYKRDVPREPDRPMDRAFLINFHHVPPASGCLALSPFLFSFLFFFCTGETVFLISPFILFSDDLFKKRAELLFELRIFEEIVLDCCQ